MSRPRTANNTPQRRQNRGGGMRKFPSSSPMSTVGHNTFTHPSFRRKVRRRRRSRPMTACAPIERTVKLGDWSAAIPIIANERPEKPHIWPQHSTQQRASLFPADGDRQLPKKIRTIPRTSAALAPKDDYGAVKPNKWEITPPKTTKELKIIAEKKRKAVLKRRRHTLEHEVLNLLACDLVDFASTAEHKAMVKKATQRIRNTRDIDPYELPATLLHRKHEKSRKPGPDPNLLDVRTHENIFRPFVPFEQQWLDLWGSQNAEKGNCNAHCVRSLYKWNELKQKGRTSNREERRRRREHSERMKRSGGRKKKVDADLEKIMTETRSLLTKPL